MARWRLVKENQRGVWRWVIRRGSERLPVADYPKDRDNEAELQAWVDRHNFELDKQAGSKRRVTVDHAYINDELVTEFERWRIKRTGGSERIPVETRYLTEYVIKFFVGTSCLPNPKDWRTEEAQDAWWESLSALAPATKQDIVGVANRFISWLRERRGSAEVPEFKLNPVSAQVMKRERGNWRAANEDAARTALPEAHWEAVKAASKKAGLYAPVMLAYSFGLRRGEIAGVKLQDAGERSFTVARTLKTIRPLVFEATKSGEPRRVPYWFATQTEALAWIADVAADRKTPDQLTDAWGDMIKVLVKAGKLPRAYSIHDLRHTFVTRAAGQFNLVRVQRAAGHSDIRTTMKYVHDMQDAA